MNCIKKKNSFHRFDCNKSKNGGKRKNNTKTKTAIEKEITISFHYSLNETFHPARMFPVMITLSLINLQRIAI